MNVRRSLVVFSISNKSDQVKAHLCLDAKHATLDLSSLESGFMLCDVCMKIYALNSDKDIDEMLLKSSWANVLKKSFSANFQNVKCSCIHSRFVGDEKISEMCSKDVDADFCSLFPNSISSINRLFEIVQKCKNDPSLLMCFPGCDQCHVDLIKDPFYESDFSNTMHDVTVTVCFGTKMFTGNGTSTNKKKAKEMASKTCVDNMMKGFRR